jgi:hypothetical protein
MARSLGGFSFGMSEEQFSSTCEKAGGEAAFDRRDALRTRATCSVVPAAFESDHRATNVGVSFCDDGLCLVFLNFDRAMSEDLIGTVEGINRRAVQIGDIVGGLERAYGPATLSGGSPSDGPAACRATGSGFRGYRWFFSPDREPPRHAGTILLMYTCSLERRLETLRLYFYNRDCAAAATHYPNEICR